MATQYKVGDKLFCVYSYRNRNNETVTIEKVGRKWLTLSNGYRADIETLMLDGGDYSSPGSCWSNEDEFTQYVALNERWKHIHDCIGRRRPEHLTMSDMDEICRLLRIE